MKHFGTATLIARTTTKLSQKYLFGIVALSKRVLESSLVSLR